MNNVLKLVILTLIILIGCTPTMPMLGINNGRLKDCPNSPNCVCSYQTDAQHAIQAIKFSGTQAQANTQLLKAINKMKRTKIVIAENNYIHAEFTSALFRFVDDIEFYFPVTEGNKTTIHLRSASRTGRSDFGVNRKRVEAFRSLLE